MGVGYSPKLPLQHDSIDENQVRKYVPYVRLVEISLINLQDIPGESQPTNSMGLQIIYTAPESGISDSLTITLK